MGRPIQDNAKRERVTLRIPDELLTEVQVIAQADDRSMSYVMRKALERCIPEMKRELGLAA